MKEYRIPIQLRWTDIDANRHMRHSAYYDCGAIARMNLLTSHGFRVAKFEEFKTGIILFREEAIFKREIVYEDKIEIDLALIKASRDFSRWSMRHHLYKNGETIAAIITVDGAWIDTEKRKLTVPNDFIQEIFSTIPRSYDFEEIVRESKA
jgi:acyl-CoA thioester hydrolase